MPNPLKRRPGSYQVAQIYEELSYALETGNAKKNVVDLLISEIEERSLVQLFEKIKARLADGNSFGKSIAAVAMEKTDFPAQLIDSSRAESLTRSFRILADLKERENNLQSFSLKSVTYPLFLVTILMLLLFFINVLIIPQFRELFSSFGADLPALTLTFISISQFGAQFWLIPVLFLLFALPAYRFSSTIRRVIDRMTLWLPYIGSRYSALHVNEFLNRLLVLRGIIGLEPRQIMELASSGIKNSFLRSRIEASDFAGDLLHWLKQSTEVPPRVKRIVSRSKDADRIWSDLEHYLDYQTRNLDRQVSNSLTNLVTVLTVAIYIVVGLFVISVYLPIFKLGSVI